MKIEKAIEKACKILFKRIAFVSTSVYNMADRATASASEEAIHMAISYRDK